jgi:hypothetical protein
MMAEIQDMYAVLYGNGLSSFFALLFIRALALSFASAR